MTILAINLLGTYAVTLHGHPITTFRSAKTQALLAYLTVETERLHQRSSLIDLLWPDQPPKEANANFRQALSRLQKIIGNQDTDPPFLHITRQSIQWNRDSNCELDVRAFQRAIDLASEQHDLDAASAQLQRALAYYQGDFLAGFAVDAAPEFENWVAITREVLHQQLLSAITHVANLAEAGERYALVADLSRRQLVISPWHEPAHRRLMRALARQGQRADALAQYDRCYDALQQELGIEPDDVTERVYQKILDGELTPVASASSHRKAAPEHEEVTAVATVAPLRLLTTELPPHGMLPAGSVMPLRRNPHFVGRHTDLLALARALDIGGTAAVSQLETAAATGLGGIGKTQLACEFVHRYGQFFSGGVFWLSFDNADAVPAEVAACGEVDALELGPDFGERDLNDQVRLVQQAWQLPTPRLLVFDNCEDPALLEQWRPTTGGCRVLVTSRRGDWELTLGVNMLALGVLTRDESLALLRKHCPDADQTTLFAIAEEVGDLPLALHLAGSYLYRYRRSVSPEQYLTELQDPKLLDHPSLTAGGISPTGHVQHVGRTFALSYNRLDLEDERDALAHTLLVHTAHFAPGEPIWYVLLVKTLGLDPAQPSDARRADDAFARLIELGMIETEESNVLRMHRLVAAFVRDVAQDAVESSQKAVEAVVFEETAQINKAVQPLPLLRWQLHLRSVVDLAQVREDLESAKLCSELGDHLWQVGDFQGALSYQEKALAIRSKILGDVHGDTATTLVHIGRVLRGLGRFEEAKSYFERSLTIRMALFGKYHQETAESLENVGRSFLEMDDAQNALPSIEEALDIILNLSDEQTTLAAEYHNNIAHCYYALGDEKNALHHLRQALAINRAVLGDEHPFTALNYHNMGVLCRESGKFAEARDFLQQALMIRRKVFGETHHDTAKSMTSLAEVLNELGEFDEAFLLARQGMQITEQRLDSYHPSTVRATQTFERIQLEREQLGHSQV